MRLVADIGGTNARLALADQGVVIDGTGASFRNADHIDFATLAAQYLADRGCSVASMVVAVAGPVGDGVARLTNHGWSFDASALSVQFGASVTLLNDLAALGHALPALGPDGVHTVTDGHDDPPKVGQALVAGIGTGFNVCAARLADGAPAQCLKAEFGHVTLPSSVAAALRDKIGTAADQFQTVEQCFSGAGVSAIHAAISGTNGTSPQDALSCSDPKSGEFADFYATLIAHLARDLRMAFMPEAGLYFAGSIARAVLSGPSARTFTALYDRPTQVDLPPMAGVRLILDDAAALRGCAAFG